MKDLKVSIVLPIYNVEKFLNHCIESVSNQTYRNLEIILIDDCSTDCCPQICDDWAKRDERIKVVHKAQNEGLGKARNTGIKMATGKYICFFDSDDYVMLNAIERLVFAMESEKAETAVFGFVDVAPNGVERYRFIPFAGEHIYRGKDVREKFLPEYIAADPKVNGEQRFYMSAWSIMYSVDKIRRLNWQFVSERDIIAEDIYSLIDLFGSIESVTVVSEALYCYRYNDESLSRKYRQDRYEKVRFFYLQTLDLCRKKNYDMDVCHRVSKHYVAFTLAALKQTASAPLPLRERMSRVNDILRDQVLQQVLHQNREDKETWSRKLMFFLIRKKWLKLCFSLLTFKNISDRAKRMAIKANECEK